MALGTQFIFFQSSSCKEMIGHWVPAILYALKLMDVLDVPMKVYQQKPLKEFSKCKSWDHDML